MVFGRPIAHVKLYCAEPGCRRLAQPTGLCGAIYCRRHQPRCRSNTCWWEWSHYWDEERGRWVCSNCEPLESGERPTMTGWTRDQREDCRMAMRRVTGIISPEDYGLSQDDGSLGHADEGGGW